MVLFPRVEQMLGMHFLTKFSESARTLSVAIVRASVCLSSGVNFCSGVRVLYFIVFS